MASPRFDIVIIGAGIVGLAAAREALSRSPRARLLVIEKENRVAAHQSGRNSGVIHSGLYYRPGSIKAMTCVSGRDALLAFCRDEGIPHTICGKVVVATDAMEAARLEELRQRGAANGVPGLAIIDAGRLRDIEPHAGGIAALHVPGAGIVDFGAVAQRFAAIVREREGVVRTGTRVIGLRRGTNGMIVETTGGAFDAARVINCAGLHCDRIAKMAGASLDLDIIPFRGEYLSIGGEGCELVGGLLYPVPDPALPFLGVHFTRRIDGELELGPNAVLAFSREGYRGWDIDAGDLFAVVRSPGTWRLLRKHWKPALGEAFRSFSRAATVRVARRLVPKLRLADLRPAPAGVRAQAVGHDGALIDDFRFAVTDGVVHVLNVPSPAATASIAVARRIIDMVEQS
jgi:L-2-hydroxyglutarate oxidase LhgO